MLRVLRLNVGYRALADGPLPPFKPPLFRGAMGDALFRSRCRRFDPDHCLHCEKSWNCPFYRMYVHSRDDVELREISRGLQAHPFVLHSSSTSTRFRRNDRFDIQITLLGIATEWLPVLVPILERTGRNGFSSACIPFRLESIDALPESTADRPLAIYGKNTIFSEQLDRLPVIRLPHPAERLEHKAVHLRNDPVLSLLTPTKLVNSLTERTEITSRMIVKAALRRRSALGSIWDSEQWAGFPFGDVLGQVDDAPIAMTQTRWIRLNRYSAAQRRRIPLEGRVGTLPLTRLPEIALSVLGQAPYLHLGKGSSFGLGRCDFTWCN